MKQRRNMPDRRHEGEAILAKVKALSVVNPETGCWEWEGEISSAGYGNIYWDKSSWTATRLVYTALHGALGKELDMCHNCDNRKCVNPDHLRADTRLNNQLEASAKKRLRGQLKTHCLRGHPLEGDNLRKASKFRGCRTCDQERQRREWHSWRKDHQKQYRARKRAERAGVSS